MHCCGQALLIKDWSKRGFKFLAQEETNQNLASPPPRKQGLALSESRPAHTLNDLRWSSGPPLYPDRISSLFPQRGPASPTHTLHRTACC